MKAAQCRAARALIGWSTQQLASHAEVGVNTVNRFEGGQDARMSSVDAIRRALEAAGVIFIAENGEGPGVRLRKQRPAVDADGTPEGWTTDPDEADRGRQG